MSNRNKKNRSNMRKQIKDNHNRMMALTHGRSEELCQSITDKWNNALDRLEAEDNQG